MFELMISKLSTAFSGMKIDELLADKPFTRKTLDVLQDRIKRESKLDIQRRDFILTRTEQLTKIRAAVHPYRTERPTAKPLLEEEQAYQLSLGVRAGYDPCERKYKSFFAQPLSIWSHIIEEDSVLIEGNNFMCAAAPAKSAYPGPSTRWW
jgi:hypothetical protein